MAYFEFLDGNGVIKRAQALDLGGGLLYLPGTILMDGVGGTLIGQELMAASLPVVIASDQTALMVIGDIAHDSPDAGSKGIKLAGRAFGVTPAEVAADDRVDAWFTRRGALVVNDGGIPILFSTAQLPSTLGQALMAASLSVAIASDQSAIPISGTVTVNEPVTVDGTVSITQPVDVDSTQLPATLGQTTMANSLPVVIASNQSAIPISGTVTVNQPVAVTSTQLPPTLGATTVANSLPVVLPTDMQDVPTTEQRFSIKGTFTDAAVTTSGPNGDIKVSTTATPSYAMASAPTIAFFDALDAGFDANPRFIYIPLQGSGLAYDKVSVLVYSSLANGIGIGYDCVVNLYAVDNAVTAERITPLDTVTLNATTKRSARWSKGTGGTAVASALLTAVGSPVYRPLDALMGPIEYLLVEMDPASDPETGALEVVVIRERGSN